MIDSKLDAQFRSPQARPEAHKRSTSFITRRRLWLYILILSFGLAACTTSTSEVPDNRATNGSSTGTAAEKPVSSDSSTDNEPAETSAPATRLPASKYADLEIITLLPRDAIPAIDDPLFLMAEEADRFYDPDELVMGVSFNGVSRAYSVPFLSNHEIVNDTVGGVKIAVTW